MLDEEQILIIPEVTYITEGSAGKIVEAAQKGCKVLLIGEFGGYNENGREWETNIMVRDLEEEENIFAIRSEDNWMVKLKQLTAKYTVYIGAKGLIVETAKDHDNRFLIHLLNPDNEEVIPFVHLIISEANANIKYKQVRVYSPENVKLEEQEIGNNYLNLRLSEFKTMATIVLE